MSNHITVIDIEVGSPEKGFAIRFGQENKMYRLANCVAWDTTNDRIGWGLPLYKYANNQQYTQWHTWEAAVKDAIAYRDANYPNYKVRVDCTVA
jgi:hypothetical protein